MPKSTCKVRWFLCAAGNTVHHDLGQTIGEYYDKAANSDDTSKKSETAYLQEGMNTEDGPRDLFECVDMPFEVVKQIALKFLGDGKLVYVYRKSLDVVRRYSDPDIKVAMAVRQGPRRRRKPMVLPRGFPSRLPPGVFSGANLFGPSAVR